jgi:hypothetical protein
MAVKLSAQEFEAALAGIFDGYSKEITEKVNAAAVQTGDELIQAIRSDAPRRTGKYAKTPAKTIKPGILGAKVVIVHFKSPGYRLAHLLEKGHGGVIAARAYPHIEKNVAKAGEGFEVKVKAAIE